MSKSAQWYQDEEEYFTRANGFVLVLVAEINSALKASGLSKAKRKTACLEAVFAVCNLFDQGWVRSEGQTSYPMLAFSKLFLNEGVTIKDIAPVLLPNKAVELHALVADIVEQYFDADREALDKHATGSVGEEVPDEKSPQKMKSEVLLIPCAVCKGSGACFCIRKGGGNATGCLRCSGNGKCRHCGGPGYPKR